MADGKLRTVLRRMRTLEQVRALRAQGDGALLERFVTSNNEAAFEVLVQRHGPMVLGACRRILGDVHDAEDAFQAVFLLLARRASAIRNPDAVGAWLHAVACQVALRARKARGQRNRVQARVGFDIGQSETGDKASVEWRELRPVLDEELGRLPEKYRAPVVLCYLEERSNTEAAEQLGWPVGTVKGRLARARSLLQTRLTRRGVALGAGLLVTAGGSKAALSAALPPTLESAIVHQAMRIATGTTPAAAGATPAVAALYKGGLHAMILTKMKLVGALLALVGVFGFSGAFTYSALHGRETVRSAETRLAPVRANKAPAPDKAKKPADAGSTEPAGAPLTARLVGAKDTYTLELGGLSAEDYRKQIAAVAKGPRRPGIGGPRYPASPKVDLKLELTNTSKEEVKVKLRGNFNKLTLDLQGPGVFYAPVVIQNFLPIRKRSEIVTIPPGKTVTITDVPTLAFPKPGVGSQAYWTAPGDYTLTVDYILGLSPAGRLEGKEFDPDPKAKGGAAAGASFITVKVHSAPLKLKVVERKK